MVGRIRSSNENSINNNKPRVRQSGLLSVCYEIDEKKYRSEWDATIGMEYLRTTLTQLGATNISFDFH